jgi:hypothetical protein
VEETEGNTEHRNDAATYTMSPASRAIDAVRLEIGKEVSLKYLTDDEIGYCLSQARGNTLLAASYAAEKISGICTDLADKSMAGSSIEWSQRAVAWKNKALELASRARTPITAPQTSSSQARHLKFRIGQHDFSSGDYL